MAGGAAILALGGRRLMAADGATPAPPWFRRALRWGQVNLTEIDPTR